MKTCTKCGETKEFSEFYTNKNVKDGYSSSCKECAKLRYKQKKVDTLLQVSGVIRSTILIENKILKPEGKRICSICKNIHLMEEMVSGNYCKPCFSKKGKEYRKQDDVKIKIKLSKAKYYKKNAEAIYEKHRKYKAENKEKCKGYWTKYAVNNKDKAKKYREENKEKIRENKKKYYELNKDRLKEYKAMWHQKNKLKKLQALEDSKCYNILV